MSQIFREENIECNNCGKILVHSVPIIVAILLAHAFIYYVVIQVVLDEGVVVVWAVTLLFMISIIGSQIFLPLVVLREDDAGQEANEIKKWYHSPIPYLVILCTIVWIWYAYGRGT